MNHKEALATLNISAGASAEEVKKAYRRLAFEMHPDLHQDKPEMARRFQLLNEAYMLLSKADSASESARANKYGSSDAETENARTEAKKAYAAAKKRFGEGKIYKAWTKNSAPQAEKKHSQAEKTRNYSEQKEHIKSKTFRTPEQRATFRQTLKDPFARSVFTEIYKQLREEKGRKHLALELEKTAVGRVTSGIVNAVKGWMKRQIDDEQEVFLPAYNLLPGKKLRLQIRQGLSGELRTIELVLPADYSKDKPIRLKGLGKKIGSLNGDLYLKILPQPALKA